MISPAIHRIRIGRLVIDADARQSPAIDTARLGAAIAARLEGSIAPPLRTDRMVDAIATAVAHALVSRLPAQPGASTASATRAPGSTP